MERVGFSAPVIYELFGSMAGVRDSVARAAEEEWRDILFLDEEPLTLHGLLTELLRFARETPGRSAVVLSGRPAPAWLVDLAAEVLVLHRQGVRTAEDQLRWEDSVRACGDLAPFMVPLPTPEDRAAGRVLVACLLGVTLQAVDSATHEGASNAASAEGSETLTWLVDLLVAQPSPAGQATRQ